MNAGFFLVTLLQSFSMSDQFTAIYQAINPSHESEKPFPYEVEDDLDGEKETLPADPANNDDVHMADLQDTILKASKGVNEQTDISYQKSFYLFCSPLLPGSPSWQSYETVPGVCGRKGVYQA
jgi:hypothetical protein